MTAGKQAKKRVCPIGQTLIFELDVWIAFLLTD